MDKYLAKGNGTSLYDHTMLAMKFAECMCDIQNIDKSSDIGILVRASVLLHDVGKIRRKFQEYLRGNIPYDKSNRVYHNIDGWAVLNTLLDPACEKNKIILSSVYWHHPKPENTAKNYMNNASSILEELQEDGVNDVNNIKEYALWLLNQNGISLKLKSDNSFYDIEDITTPRLFQTDGVDAVPLIVRSFLTSSDRLSSRISVNQIAEYLSDDKKCLSFLNQLDSKEIWNVQQPVDYDPVRFYNQTNLANEIQNNRLIRVSAPAGYGKTLVGIMWAAKLDKKIIWVVPRNIVAHEVYDSILSELNAVGLSHVSVELILTSTRLEATHPEKEIFSSDIVVTNIDNFLYPIVRNNVADRLFAISNRHVIFDEYHEFVQEGALYRGFINVVRSRNYLQKSKSLFLSATPIPLEFLWSDGIDVFTTVYPNTKHHLPAVHNKPYKISFITIGEKSDFFTALSDKINKDNFDNYIAFVNSIKCGQILYDKSNADVLIHSDFLDEDLLRIKRRIIDRFGKRSTNTENLKVISTPILGTATDISTNHVYISISSPELTMQKCGRCNRWGLDDDATITFIYTQNRSERAARNVNYEDDLSLQWSEFLYKSLSGKTTASLNDLYDLYNQFNHDHLKAIKKFLRDKLKISRDNLAKIYPVRFVDNEGEEVNSENPDADVIPERVIRETLRGSDENSVYFICRYYGTDKFIEPMVEKIYKDSIHKHFDEDNDTQLTVTKLLRSVIDQYEYPRGVKKGKFTMSSLADLAWVPTRPYIVPKWYYSTNYGIVATKTGIFPLRKHK